MLIASCIKLAFLAVQCLCIQTNNSYAQNHHSKLSKPFITSNVMSKERPGCPHKLLHHLKLQYGFKTPLSPKAMSPLDVIKTDYFTLTTYSNWSFGFPNGTTASGILNIASEPLYRLPNFGLLLEPAEILFGLTWLCSRQQQDTNDWWKLVLTTFGRYQTTTGYISPFNIRHSTLVK